MSKSIIFSKEKKSAVKDVKDYLIEIGATITKEAEINNGLGIKFEMLFEDNANKLIIYFKHNNRSSKIVLEKTTDELNRLLLQRFEDHSDGLEVSEKHINLHVGIQITDPDKRKEVRNQINNMGLEISELDRTDYMDYLIRVKDGLYKATITQFKTGNLLLQGIYSSLPERLIELIDKIKPLTSVEKALLYVPEENKNEVEEKLKEVDSIFKQPYETSSEDLGAEVFNFLFENDQKTFVTGQEVLSIIEASDRELPEFNFLVAPFAKVFEGFVIKLMIEKDFFTLAPIFIQIKHPKFMKLPIA